MGHEGPVVEASIFRRGGRTELATGLALVRRLSRRNAGACLDGQRWSIERLMTPHSRRGGRQGDGRRGSSE